VRATLIVNSFATTTSDRVRAALEEGFSAEHDVQVEHTQGRGHATLLAAKAKQDGAEVIVVLGGDGTVNEVVNGVLAGNDPEAQVDLLAQPVIAVVPGGSANVVARGLGLPPDPVDATLAALRAIRAGSHRTLSIGHIQWWDDSVEPAQIPQAQQRWVVFSAGMGLDAEVIAAMELERAAGRRATPTRYAQLTLRQWLRTTNQRHPGLVVSMSDRPALDAFVVIVCLTSPWTYVGPIPIIPAPEASYDADLDVIALQDLRLGPVTRMAGRMVSGLGLAGLRGVQTAHDEPAVTVRARRLTALHVDGDLLGHMRGARVRSARQAIRLAVPEPAG
jgi:diacylglycerol kinase family enzyme